MPMGLSAGLHAAVSQYDAAGHATVLHAAARAAAGYTGPPGADPGPGPDRVDARPLGPDRSSSRSPPLTWPGSAGCAGPGSAGPAGRVIASLRAGLRLAIIATMSFLRVYQPVLFYARAAQTIVLLLLVPVFLGAGPAGQPGHRGAAPGGPPDRGRHRQPGPPRLVTFPAITTMVSGHHAVPACTSPRGTPPGSPREPCPRADLRGPAGARVRVLLDPAAHRPGAQGPPPYSGVLVDQRGRGHRGRDPGPGHHCRPRPCIAAAHYHLSPGRGGRARRPIRSWAGAPHLGARATSWDCRSWSPSSSR